MGRKRWPPNDPREWINRAESSLVQARMRNVDVYREDLCFHAQQAAEKAIKAVFVHRGLAFPYSHDLVRLLTLLTNAGVKVPKYVRRADQLNVYAVESRYPGLSGPVTHRQWRTAVGIAEKIVRWANRQI